MTRSAAIGKRETQATVAFRMVHFARFFKFLLHSNQDQNRSRQNRDELLTPLRDYTYLNNIDKLPNKSAIKTLPRAG